MDDFSSQSQSCPGSSQSAAAGSGKPAWTASRTQAQSRQKKSNNKNLQNSKVLG